MNFLWAIFLLLASYAIQMLTTTKASTPDKATLSDFDFPQFDEGTPQAVYFGDNWSPDFFVAWYGNLRTTEVTSSSSKK